MTAEGLPPVLRRMLDLWNGAPIDAGAIYAATCSENGVGTFTPADIVTDVARLRASLADLVFGVEGWAPAGDWYLLRMTAQGVHRGELQTPLGAAAPSGRSLRLTGLEAFQVIDDRIAAVWLRWDWSEAYAALGATLGGGAPPAAVAPAEPAS